MKRPLFWSVISYALGEVMYFYTDRVIQRSIMVIMLFCCGFIFTRRKEKNIYLFFILMFLFGMIFPNINECRSAVSRKRIYSNNERYSIYINKKNNDTKRYISGQAVVVDKIKTVDGKTNIKVKVLESNVNKQKNASNYYINICDINMREKVCVGSKIVFDGMFCAYKDKTNPGEFSYRNYNENRKTYYYGYYNDLSKISLCGLDNRLIIGWLYKGKDYICDFRNDIRNAIYDVCGDETADLYVGIILGDKKSIEADTMDLYKRAGIAHVLAISGLHISMIGGMLYKLLKKLGLGFLGAGIISVIILISYGILTGNSVATIRAIIMLIHWIIAQILGKKADTLTSLAISLFLILIFNPNMIIEAALQISFISMIGIICSNYVIKRISNSNRYKKQIKKYKFISKMIFAVIHSLILSVVTFPVIASFYYEVSLYSCLTNLVVIPLMTVVILCGLFGVIVSAINIKIACAIIAPGRLVLYFYKMLCELIIRLPHSNYNIGELSILQVIIYYVLLLLIFLLFDDKHLRFVREFVYRKIKYWMDRKTMGYIRMMAITIIVLISGAMLNYNVIVPKEQILFLDVGQGDCILIKTKSDVNIVIDGGSSSDNSVGKNVIMPALKCKCMWNIDYWFVSHFDSDHISGLQYILEKGELSGIHIKNIVVSKYIENDDNYEVIKKLANKNNINFIYIDSNTSIKDDSFIINVIHPSMKFFSHDINDKSLCFLYKSKNISIAFTGDIGEAAMEEIANSEDLKLGEYDILKVPHHGSKNSYNEKYYNKFRFKYSVISCGYQNRYNHPHDEIISLLESKNVEILRTDYMGAIEIYVH